jgi:hypothetical protein
MVIDGKTYTSDIILYPDKVDDNWWRKSGHLLQKEDLRDVIKYNPEILIVGTGAYGLMKILDETKQFLKVEGIELIFEKTKESCKIYNELKDKKKIVAAFHITC